MITSMPIAPRMRIIGEIGLSLDSPKLPRSSISAMLIRIGTPQRNRCANAKIGLYLRAAQSRSIHRTTLEITGLAFRVQRSAPRHLLVSSNADDDNVRNWVVSGQTGLVPDPLEADLWCIHTKWTNPIARFSLRCRIHQRPGGQALSCEPLCRARQTPPVAIPFANRPLPETPPCARRSSPPPPPPASPRSP